MKFPDDYLNRVVCGDCLEVMRGMPDGGVDFVLTDPPYGIGESNKKNLSRGNMAAPKDYGDYSWDKEKIGRDKVEEIRRISKDQIIFGGNYYAGWLPSSSCWIVWDKRNGDNDFADCELAWTSLKKAVRKIEHTWNGMIRQGGEERFHPTQKPLRVMEWIIDRFTSPNDLILDPFAGSGTTLVAAKMLGRRYIGIEIDPKYCAIAEERLRNTTPPLPFETEKKMEQANLL